MQTDSNSLKKRDDFDPPLWKVLVMEKGKLVVFLTALGIISITIMWCFILDTNSHRRFTNWRIYRIAALAKENPDDSQYAEQLLRMAHSEWSFKACKATNALGDIGIAARPIILDIAELMDSTDLCVSQEAAKSLIYLAPLSERVLPQLMARIKREPSDPTAWFAVQALGEIGEPAAVCLPLLRSKLGTEPEMFKDTVQMTIQKIERKMKESKAGTSSLGSTSEMR